MTCPVCGRKSSKPCTWLPGSIPFHCKCCLTHFKRLSELQQRPVNAPCVAQQEAKGFGTVMGELERVYGLSRTSGGTRQSVQDALVELCAKGVLERKSEANQWMYFESPEFKERVKK